MDLCLMIEGQEGVTWPQWTALAAACEEHGIPTLFRSDHYLNLDGQHPERGSLDAWATINALAALTTTLRLGTLVSPASFRHPSVLAKLVVTADHVSGGRIDLGIGAGWHEREHDAYGFRFKPTGVRMDVLEEQLQVLMGHWGDEPFSFDGKHYVLSDLDAQPKPVQQPHPHLIMGGSRRPAERGARRALRRRVQHAVSRRSRRSPSRRGRDRGGVRARRPRSDPVLGDDRDRARRRRRGPRGPRAPGRRADRLRARRAAARAAEGWVVATVDDAAEQFAAYRDAGLHRVMCQTLVHDDLDAVALIGRLAPLLA